jgi:hypothetical protein
LSQGSIIVHWRAEWPEHPPFSPEARVTRAPPPPFHGQVSGPFTLDSGPPPAGYGYPFMAGPPAPPAYTPHAGFGPALYTDPYHQAPPQPYQPQAPLPVHAPPPGPPGYGPPQQYPPQPGSYPPYQPPVGPYPNGAVDPAPVYNPLQGPNYTSGYTPFQASAAPPSYPTPGPPVYPDNYQTKLEDVARNSREVWQSLGNIKDLPGSVRVLATIHHLVRRFRSRFFETPPLSLFNDGLSDNKDMRPVRNVNGLVCKACHLGLGNGPVEEDRKSFSLPQLTKHFQTKHIEPMQAYNAPPLDWVVDMVLLTDQTSLSTLRSAMSEYQKSLVADALPNIFQPHSAGGHIAQHAAPEGQSFGANDHAASHAGGYGMSHGQAPQQQSVGDPASATRTPDSYKPFEQPSLPSRPDVNLYQPRRHEQSEIANFGSSFFTDLEYPESRATDGAASHTDSPGNGRQSPQGRRHEQNSHQPHRKNSGRNKRDRGKPQGSNGPGRNRFKDDSGRDAEETRPDDHGSRAMWATDNNGSVRTFSSSGRTGPVEYQGGPPPHHHAPNGSRGAPPRSEPASQMPNEQPNLLSALEMHLDQRRTPMADGGQRTSHPHYADSRNTTVAAETRSLSRSNVHYGPDNDRSRSPTHGPQYRPSYHPRPGHHDTYDTQYKELRSPLEAPPRRYEGAPSRMVDDGHGPGILPEHYRYSEDVRPEPRQAVQAYEIVQVIDETGEYYIRRPIRHAPEPRYASEIRRDNRDDYTPHDAVYVGAARQTRPVEAPRGVRMEDPAYYEEYDPRFPGA